jgi:hypothetical protein
MNTQRSLFVALPLAALLLAGCGQGGSSKGGFLSGVSGMARQKILENNMEIHGDSGLPKAELTPQGDLLIDGRKIAADAKQHELLLKYRHVLESIAIEGVDVGMQGADLAGKAVSETVSGALSGHADEAKEHVRAEAEQVKNSARDLCKKLPDLLNAQNELAAAMPEFKPYARMTPDKLKKCEVK